MGKDKDIRFEKVKKETEINFKNKEFEKISYLDTNSPPSVFIGSKLKYPQVNIGILSPFKKEENSWMYDNPRYWAENELNISDVLNFRNNLVNSRFKSNVKSDSSNKKFVEIAKEIAISSNQVDLEIKLKNKMKQIESKDKVLIPHGVNASLEDAKIVGNLKVEKKVDSVINDELKTTEAIDILNKSGINEYSISKILSVGVLGLKKNKKFVPTRWSITATDDIIGKKLIEKIKDYKIIEDYELHFGEFLGNQYIVMLFPDIWEYELFEIYLPKSSWNPSDRIKASTDYEGNSGRKEYAYETAGGYYASRLPILSYLESIKRQASILVIRIETPSYWAPLGVWVVRESVKKAMKKNIKFSDEKEFIDNSIKIAKIKYNLDISFLIRKSKIIHKKKEQKKLNDFFKN
ncbi:hypothetical protein GYA25_01725 [Candidatus Woesearchaeota archaeon]|jgi:hypothetical protein|nr:hypothetical protein [Candidatus Woesearchaeota archaeon]